MKKNYYFITLNLVFLSISVVYNLIFYKMKFETTEVNPIFYLILFLIYASIIIPFVLFQSKVFVKFEFEFFKIFINTYKLNDQNLDAYKNKYDDSDLVKFADKFYSLIDDAYSKYWKVVVITSLFLIIVLQSISEANTKLYWMLVYNVIVIASITFNLLDFISYNYLTQKFSHIWFLKKYFEDQYEKNEETLYCNPIINFKILIIVNTIVLLLILK